MSTESEVERYCRPTPIVKGEECTSRIGRFQFEAGGVLDDLVVGYVTHGELNAQRDNAVLLLPGTTNSRHSADGYIGPGNAFDPAKHFIIAFEAVGSGSSSKPSDGLGEAFPQYNIRDLVRAQAEVVAREFGLQRFAVAGASMGAFQSLEWAIHFPQLVSRAVLLVPATQAGTVFRWVVETARQIIQLDPAWREGATMAGLASLSASLRLYFPWTVSDTYLERVAPEDIAREVSASFERSGVWNVWDYLKRYQASASHDVAQPFGGDLAAALARVSAPTLVMPTSSDRLLSVSSARDIARHVRHAKLVVIETDRGHLGWRAVDGARESREIAAAVQQFLRGDGA